MAANTPKARARAAGSVNVVASSASAVGAAIAPPAPWAARAMISIASLLANPPTSDAAAKIAMPIMNMRRRPKRSPVRPPKSSSPPKASE